MIKYSPLFHRTRLKLAGTYAGVMGCLLGLCGLGLYQVVVHDYRESIDQGLESVAGAIRDAIEPHLDHTEAWQQVSRQFSLTLCTPEQTCAVAASDLDPLVKAASPVNYYLRLLNLRNRPIALGGSNLERIPQTSGTVYLQTLTNSSGLRFRQISLPLSHNGYRWGYVQVGRSLVDFDHHLHSLRWSLLLGLPLVVALIAGSSWWLSGLAMRPMYASYRQMQQFTSDAAHEFRTPLTAMRSTIEAVQQTHLRQACCPNHPLGEVAKVLEVLQRQSMRLSQLVNDLLLLASIEHREPIDYSQPCELDDIIRDLIEELAFLAVQARVSLTLAPPEGSEAGLAEGVTVPLRVLGHEDQLYRLFSNLIINGIQATAPGGYVTVALSRVDQRAVVQISDTGAGIDPTDLPHLFDRFYRVHQDRSRDTGGSGLGLAIARAIVQAHQGSIQVRSTPGQGSQFIVRLPID
ncbi:two-component system sensor histidine kinase RppB [Nodosilinea nodulosa]|uniref:two-component system sensor histidine kinase RppB n=1 Tax=Nodosilinea nodulosa TaxID=416001 RepID=UPI0002EDDA5F|nr:two-component system sensor histidine kinase RppB [Nodosilinea nodulosa]